MKDFIESIYREKIVRAADRMLDDCVRPWESHLTIVNIEVYWNVIYSIFYLFQSFLIAAMIGHPLEGLSSWTYFLKSRSYSVGLFCRKQSYENVITPTPIAKR